MRHVFDEIILDGAQLLLTQECTHSQEKGSYYDECEHNRSNDHPLDLLKHNFLDVRNNDDHLFIWHQPFQIASAGYQQWINKGFIMKCILGISHEVRRL